MRIGTITFQSSIEQLNKGFAWAKEQALAYVREDEQGAGKWYEAALPGRNAFCMRDVGHQAEGAAALGLEEYTRNMLYLFAKSISKERDYCGYWEITGEGLPCPDDYESDSDFWYNLPGSFEVITACYMQYLWTKDDTYLTDSVFCDFYRQSCEEFVRQWDLDGDGILEHYPWQGRRGIATYNETDIGIKAGADMLASQYAAYGCMARMQALTGNQKKAGEYREKQETLKKRYLSEWHRDDGKGFYGAILRNGEFLHTYHDTGNFLPIRFGLLDGEPQMQEAIMQMKEHEPQNVEERSYYPQIFYRCGERDRGLHYLLSLCDPNLARKEYPEVSYALVGTVVNWLMGIRREETGEIVTCAALPVGESAKVEQLPIAGGIICVAHSGSRETVFENCGAGAVRWKAAFLGDYECLYCQGKPLSCSHEKNAAGEKVSYVILEIESGEELAVRAEGKPEPE